MLQKAIDIIWNNITWRYDLKSYRRRRYAKVKGSSNPKECQVQERAKERVDEG